MPPHLKRSSIQAEIDRLELKRLMHELTDYEAEALERLKRERLELP